MYIRNMTKLQNAIIKLNFFVNGGQIAFAKIAPIYIIQLQPQMVPMYFLQYTLNQRIAPLDSSESKGAGAMAPAPLAR